MLFLADCKIQLEVVSGPVAGLHAEKQVVGSNAMLAIGRLPQNDLVLSDPEVSGKHVVISWNAKVRAGPCWTCNVRHSNRPIMVMFSSIDLQELQRFGCVLLTYSKGCCRTYTKHSTFEAGQSKALS